jgi:TetR/AcrR family transcriptional regulator
VAQPVSLPPRLPKAERTRAAILAAAERLFAERGFDAARLEDVAAAVGIRRASIVYHFRDKAELYDAVLADVLGALFARLEQALLGAGAFAGRVEAAVSALIDTLAARPTLARLLLREVADGTPRPSARLAPHLAPFFALVERALAASDASPPTGVDPVAVASQVAGGAIFYLAAMPVLLPGVDFDPVEPARLAALRRELLGVVRRLLGAG